MHVVFRLIVRQLDIPYSTLYILQCLSWLAYRDHSRNQPRSEPRPALVEWGPFPSISLFASLVFSSHGRALIPNVRRTYVHLPGRKHTITSLHLLVLSK